MPMKEEGFRIGWIQIVYLKNRNGQDMVEQVEFFKDNNYLAK